MTIVSNNNDNTQSDDGYTDNAHEWEANVEDFALTPEEITELHHKMQQAQSDLLTIRDFIRFGVTQLREYDVVVAQGTTDEFAESAALVLHSLSLDWQANEQILDCRLIDSEKQAVLSLLSERITERKPLSYLIGLAYFCDLPFYVDERVLIPRSPIAELIKQKFFPYFASENGQADDGFEHGLEEKHLSHPERILDLCTGSGCIAIALAKNFVDSAIDAVDLSKDALEVAWTNVEHHQVSHQVQLIESNLFDKLPMENQYELIVTNPPYVDAKTMAELPPEFLYEPELALAAGQDGLSLVHKILYHAPDYLTRDGLLVCEVGDSEWALRQAYPQVQFNWLDFEKGGHGIFAINREELVEYRELFEQYAKHIV